MGVGSGAASGSTNEVFSGGRERGEHVNVSTEWRSKMIVDERWRRGKSERATEKKCRPSSLGPARRGTPKVLAAQWSRFEKTSFRQSLRYPALAPTTALLTLHARSLRAGVSCASACLSAGIAFFGLNA